MIWKILVSLLLGLSLASQATAQQVQGRTSGEAVASSFDLQNPITMGVEVEITSADPSDLLIKFLDANNFSVQLINTLKKGGDSANVEKVTVKATKTEIVTSQAINQLAEEVRALTVNFKHPKGSWTYRPSK